ncbi:MAG: hypothetical protein ACRCXT_18920 [Paraclostridium sp.]
MYNFSKLEVLMSALKGGNHSPYVLKDIQRELNIFYKDSRCLGIMFSNNTDKPFFGMCVIPSIPEDTIRDLVVSSNRLNKRIENYYIDIDSKLLEIGFTNRELVAILLHEIGHVVNTIDPLNCVQDAVHIYLDKDDSNINIIGIRRNMPLFTFAIQDSVYMITSIFRRKDDEILADEFVIRCGYGEDLNTAFNKIMSNITQLNNTIDNKFLVLQWTMRVIKEFKVRRIPAIKTLNKSIKMTGSTLKVQNMTRVRDNINKYQDEKIIEESMNIFKKGNSIFSKLKYNGMRTVENDLFEINLDIKNVDEHDNALAIMRRINANMGIIEDFIRSEKLSDKELERWEDVLNKYRMARSELSKKQTHDEKFYGLFVQMPNIKSRYEL